MGNIVHVGQSARHEDIALASFGQYGIRRHLEVFGEKNVFVGGAKAGKSESGHLERLREVCRDGTLVWQGISLGTETRNEIVRRRRVAGG